MFRLYRLLGTVGNVAGRPGLSFCDAGHESVPWLCTVGSWVVSFEPVIIFILALARCDRPDWSAFYRCPSERLPVVSGVMRGLPQICQVAAGIPVGVSRIHLHQDLSVSKLIRHYVQSAAVTGVNWGAESHRAMAARDVLEFECEMYVRLHSDDSTVLGKSLQETVKCPAPTIPPVM